MKLDMATIKNFRSIKDVDIHFDPPCRILVGINESGKSNILKALSLLSDDLKPVKKDDQREALPDEEPISESYIRFVFKFNKEEIDELYEAMNSLVLSNEKNPDIIAIGETKKNIKEFCATRNEGLYRVNIIEERKYFQYWTLGSSYKLLPGWKKPTSNCPSTFKVDVNGEQLLLSQFKLVRASDLAEVPEGYLEDATIEDLGTASGNVIIKITKECLPDTLFWEYDETNLLPSAINITSFKANPDSCLPLKNMFMLAGVIDIQAGIDDAKKGTPNQFQNYLDRVAKRTTTHFREVWKEYRNIEFSLKLNAEQIIPGVKEENTHDFSRRSDGFKRFVTFLLMISVNVKTDALRDTLLLIDEPEIGLHPSGVRYLSNELIRISKKNYVACSTHSIFMIDSGDISRHFIVKKKDEITKIEPVKESNIADEEVLYLALGHSMFSILNEKNIIFEGWKDKRLFNVAIGGSPAELKEKFKSVGVCHAKGASAVKTVTPMIELAKRECLIISDSDDMAKSYQKKYRQDKCYGEWKTYQEIDPKIKAITGEDFISNEYIAKQVKSVLASSSMPAFEVSILPDKKGKLAALSKWLTHNGMNSDQTEETLKNIKNLIFENLKYQNIDIGEYSKLLHGIPLG